MHGLPLGWPVRGEPELAGGGAEGEGFGFDSVRVELNWGVAKLLGWMDGAMWGCGDRSV